MSYLISIIKSVKLKEDEKMAELKEENSASKTLIKGLRQTNIRLQRENDDYVEEVDEMKEQFEKDLRSIKLQANGKHADTAVTEENKKTEKYGDC